MRRIAHIINPVLVDESSDLHVAQSVTFETMRAAREFAKDRVEVELFSAQYSEDRSFVPNGFQTTPDLERSILDFGTFEKERKLPLIKDILDRLYETTDAEYLIYTNVDIALVPNFYLAVDKFIEKGRDTFVINRRTIPAHYKDISEIPLMCSEAGEPHPGYDCFVFKRDAYPKYEIGNVCIGMHWVGRVLLANIFCHASNFEEFKDRHLTFHIGNDMAWKNEGYSDYEKFNTEEALKALKALEVKYGPFDRGRPPGSYIRDVEMNQNLHPQLSRGTLLGRLIRWMRTTSRQ
jgi:hypothetical protein